MTADELLTKGDMEKALAGMKSELISTIQNLLKGKTDPVYNAEQAAEFLKCSTATIRRRAAAGEIAFSRDGSDLKFLESDLRSYLKANRVMTMDECRMEMVRNGTKIQKRH